MMESIWMILGTRPEAIKMCPLLPALQEVGLSPHVAVSGQHHELLIDALAVFGITPAHNMHIMRPGQTPNAVLAAVLRGTEDLLKQEHPLLVLVHGDTMTAYGAALACFLAHVPIAHIEAGLRTGDMASPFPEEFCRRSIAPLSTLHFAPTQKAKRNLLQEGIPSCRIFVTGNTGIDALAYTYRKEFSHPALTFAAGRRLILLTVHRRESFGKPMKRIFSAILRLTQIFPDICFYYPVHPNPDVREAAKILKDHPAILLGEPEGPISFHNLLARCDLVMTDSGGLQEEAPYFHKPVLVLRRQTERGEGVEAGVLQIVGDEEGRIVKETARLLCDANAYRTMAEAKSPFGDGKASRRIAKAIRRYIDTIKQG